MTGWFFGEGIVEFQWPEGIIFIIIFYAAKEVRGDNSLRGGNMLRIGDGLNLSTYCDIGGVLFLLFI